MFPAVQVYFSKRSLTLPINVRFFAFILSFYCCVYRSGSMTVSIVQLTQQKGRKTLCRTLATYCNTIDRSVTQVLNFGLQPKGLILCSIGFSDPISVESLKDTRFQFHAILTTTRNTRPPIHMTPSHHDRDLSSL